MKVHRTGEEDRECDGNNDFFKGKEDAEKK